MLPSVISFLFQKEANAGPFLLICVSYNYIVASLDSTAQTGQPSGDDWQEEVYQKVIFHFLSLLAGTSENSQLNCELEHGKVSNDF